MPQSAPALTDAQRGYIEAQYRLFKSWYADWCGQGGVLAECA